MTKHTQGPWRIDFSDFGTDTDSRGIPISDGGGLIADVAPLGGRVGDLCLASWHNFGDDEDIANARLIAAAPDMLAALRALDDVNLDIVTPDGKEIFGREAVDAAITKATGEEKDG